MVTFSVRHDLTVPEIIKVIAIHSTHYGLAEKYTKASLTQIIRILLRELGTDKSYYRDTDDIYDWDDHVEMATELLFKVFPEWKGKGGENST